MPLTPTAEGFVTFAQAREVVGGGTAYTLPSAPGVRGPLSVRIRTTPDTVIGLAQEQESR